MARDVGPATKVSNRRSVHFDDLDGALVATLHADQVDSGIPRSPRQIATTPVFTGQYASFFPNCPVIRVLSVFTAAGGSQFVFS
jgi:hypothetical protein